MKGYFISKPHKDGRMAGRINVRPKCELHLVKFAFPDIGKRPKKLPSL